MQKSKKMQKKSYYLLYTQILLILAKNFGLYD